MDQKEISKEMEDVKVVPKFEIKLKDFDGKQVMLLRLMEPLPFPYLFWNQRLFVTSKDEPGVLLERSYMVYMHNPPAASDTIQ